MQEIQLYIFKNKFSYKYDCNFFYDFFNIYIEFFLTFVCVCVYICMFFFFRSYIFLFGLYLRNYKWACMQACMHIPGSLKITFLKKKIPLIEEVKIRSTYSS